MSLYMNISVEDVLNGNLFTDTGETSGMDMESVLLAVLCESSDIYRLDADMYALESTLEKINYAKRVNTESAIDYSTMEDGVGAKIKQIGKEILDRVAKFFQFLWQAFKGLFAGFKEEDIKKAEGKEITVPAAVAEVLKDPKAAEKKQEILDKVVSAIEPIVVKIETGKPLAPEEASSFMKQIDIVVADTGGESKPRSDEEVKMLVSAATTAAIMSNTKSYKSIYSSGSQQPTKLMGRLKKAAGDPTTNKVVSKIASTLHKVGTYAAKTFSDVKKGTVACVKAGITTAGQGIRKANDMTDAAGNMSHGGMHPSLQH